MWHLDTHSQLPELYQCRLDELREMANKLDLVKLGSVEQLRARLIANIVLKGWPLDWTSIQTYSNQQLSYLLAVFGIKRSGSIKERKQRLWLHIHQDSKKLNPDTIDSLTRDELHELCIRMGLPRSGSKGQLFGRVAGVISNQHGGWGKVKKSLRRPRGSVKLPSRLPPPSEISPELVTTQKVVMENTEPELIIEPEPETESNDVLESEEILDASIVEDIAEFEPVIEEVEVSMEAEEVAAILELDNRAPELDSAIRDFLVIGKIEDSDDLDAFMTKLGAQGFAVEFVSVKNKIQSKLTKLNKRMLEEKESLVSGPSTWREREALRHLEQLRPTLISHLDEILSRHGSNLVSARMNFEQVASDMGLDLVPTAVSGRIHGLFDIHVSLNEDKVSEDPNSARRERLLKVLQHASNRLSDESKYNLDRLEANIYAFEQLVEAILKKDEGNFGPSQQALLIRFLQNRGYRVNTHELRSRVLSAAGVIAVELGYITPEEMPRLPAGLEFDGAGGSSLVHELKSVVRNFREAEGIVPPEVEEYSEIDDKITDAAVRLDNVKEKFAEIDDILNRMHLTDNDETSTET